MIFNSNEREVIRGTAIKLREPTSHGLSAGSMSLSTSLVPAAKPRDVGEEKALNLMARGCHDRQSGQFFSSASYGASAATSKSTTVKGIGTAQPPVQWKIRQSTTCGHFFRHFIPARGQRVNEPYYLKIDKAENGKRVENFIQVLVCEPVQQDAGMARILIGLHKNSQISIMAMPKIGVSHKLCQYLSGRSCPAVPSTLHQDENPNGHVYQFSYNAGHDRRPRACLTVCCDNEADLDRLFCFFEGMDAFCPFDNNMMELIQVVLEHAEKQLKGRAEIEKLQLEKSSLGQNPVPVSRLPKSIGKPYEVIHTQIHHLEQELQWQSIDFPLKKERLFAGYPNLTPDLVSEPDLNRYRPETILHYPEKLPDIFQWILLRQFDVLEQNLAQDSLLMFTLDFEGRLPVEVAINILTDVPIAELLIKHWLALPREKQWCRNVFYEAMNSLARYESHPFQRLDAEMRKNNAVVYLRKWQDGSSLPDILNDFLKEHDEQQLHFLQEVIHNSLQQDEQKLLECIGANISDRQMLFKAFLMDDWELMKAALWDDFPDDRALWRAVMQGNEEKVKFYASEPGIRDDVKMQQILENLADWYPLCKEIKRVEKAIQSLDETCSDEDVAIEYPKLAEQLLLLNEEKKCLLATFRSYKPENYPSLDSSLNQMPLHYNYLKNLKRRCRKEMYKAASSSEQKTAVYRILSDEILLIYRMYQALKTKNHDDMKSLSKLFDQKGQKWRKFYLEHYYRYHLSEALIQQRMKDDFKRLFSHGSILPKNIELFFFAWQKNYSELEQAAKNQLSEFEQYLAKLRENAVRDAVSRKRPDKFCKEKCLLSLP